MNELESSTPLGTSNYGRFVSLSFFFHNKTFVLFLLSLSFSLIPYSYSYILCLYYSSFLSLFHSFLFSKFASPKINNAKPPKRSATQFSSPLNKPPQKAKKKNPLSLSLPSPVVGRSGAWYYFSILFSCCFLYLFCLLYLFLTFFLWIFQLLSILVYLFVFSVCLFTSSGISSFVCQLWYCFTLFTRLLHRHFFN